MLLLFTVGYETNLENNVKRKKAKYRELVKELNQDFNEVKFVNLSMSSLGIFAQECSSFLETLALLVVLTQSTKRTVLE